MPRRSILPFFTMLPKTASTVVGLISGKILQISALEIGVNEFKTVASIRAFFGNAITVNNSKTLIKFLITHI